MLPALALYLFALGILERDGVWIIVGGLVGALSLALVAGVLLALVKGAIFAISNAIAA